METEYLCESCGYVVESSEYDKLDTLFCPECGGGRIEETEVLKPIVIAPPKNQGNLLLINCESCQHNFSKRALKCPKCEWVPTATCKICKSKIPLNSTTCIECGDPNPFVVQTNPSPMPDKSSENKKNEIKCPQCNSTQLTSQKKGFGLGKAAVGGILMGGVGLLGGVIGSGKIIITCLQCGHSWKASKS